MKSTALVLAALLALSLTGCGGDDEPTDEGTPASTPSLPVSVGTVEGRLVIADGAGEERTVPGKLLIKGPGGSVLTADITDDGRFAIQLAPGKYRITATSPESADPCTTEVPVTVLVADETVETVVVCRAG